MPIKPEKIELSPSDVSIVWSDDHRSIYQNKFLRGQCPCAHCVEEWTGRRVLNLAAIPEYVHALDYMEVGRYALQFLWSDSHDTGIYPYALLRDLCQCQKCQGAKPVS